MNARPSRASILLFSLFLSLAGDVEAQAPRTSSPMGSSGSRPSPASLEVTGYALDTGRCLDPFDTDEASASMPSELELVRSEDGTRWLVTRDVTEASRRSLLAWTASRTIARRRFVVTENHVDGRVVSWLALCLVENPLVGPTELVLGPAESRRDPSGATHVHRTLGFGEATRANLRDTLTTRLVLVASDGCVVAMFPIPVVLSGQSLELDLGP